MYSAPSLPGEEYRTHSPRSAITAWPAKTSSDPPSKSTRSIPASTTVYSSNCGVCLGSLQPEGDFMWATLTASVPEFTRPMYSSMSFGLLPADVMRVAFFPFYVLGLLIFCRIGRFDNWPWPPGLLIVYAAVAFLIVFFCGLVRKQAEAVRREALKALRMHEDKGDAIIPGKGSDNKLAAMRSEVCSSTFVPALV